MARKKTEAPVVTKKSLFDTVPPKAVLIIGALFTLVGIVFTCIASLPRVKSIGAVENFSEKCIVIEEGKLNSDNDGQPIIVSGKLAYSENGAVDAVLGISADSPLLYRISEMYQWTLVDGKPVAAWAEQIAESPDPEHTNPSAYPSNMKSEDYTAEGVKIGDYVISTDLLLMLDGRTKLTPPADFDVRGFKASGEYITNSENLDSPKIGDVRIRYEYVSVSEATFAGKQRSSSIVSFKNYEDVPIFLSLTGIHEKQDVISEIRHDAAPATVWLLVLSAVSALVGGFSFFYALCRVTGYKPSLSRLGKKFADMAHEKVAAVHSVAFALLAFLLPFSLVWAKVYEIGIAFIGVIFVLWLILIVSDMLINMPKLGKKEAEYVPILVKRDEEPAKRSRK